MAIGKCKECGGQVSSSANVCPHCGAKPPKKAGVLGWLFVLFIVLPTAWVIGTGIGSAPSVGQPSAPTQAAAPKQPEWMRSEYRAPMTDAPVAVLSMRSVTATEFDFPYQQPGGSHLTMNFRRNAGELDAYLSIDKGQMLCSYRSCKFSLRVGDEQPQEWTGVQSSTNDSDMMFVRDAAELERIIKKGGKIRIGIEFHRAGTRAFEFDVGGYPGV